MGHGYMRMPRKNDEIVIWENIWMNLIITSRRDVMEWCFWSGKSSPNGRKYRLMQEFQDWPQRSSILEISGDFWDLKDSMGHGPEWVKTYDFSTRMPGFWLIAMAMFAFKDIAIWPGYVSYSPGSSKLRTAARYHCWWAGACPKLPWPNSQQTRTGTSFCRRIGIRSDGVFHTSSAPWKERLPTQIGLSWGKCREEFHTWSIWDM